MNFNSGIGSGSGMYGRFGGGLYGGGMYGNSMYREVTVDCMDLLECMVVGCIMVVLEARWVVMEWAWAVRMECKIQIIHMVILLLLLAFGYQFLEW